MVLCGARFCTAAESRYHPIEGELLGVTWALEKTGYYTLGCTKLLVLVDHKPLIGLLTKRELGAIENPRLEHLAERLMRWTFVIQHIAGARNFGPDALSRSPGPAVPPGSLGVITDEVASWSDDVEGQVRATAESRRVLVVSWDVVKTAGVSDKTQSDLLHALTDETDHSWTPESKDYKRYAKDMSVVDGVPLYKGRVVIPPVLRPEVLRALHRAHQETTGMALRAHESVWWPSFTKEL